MNKVHLTIIFTSILNFSFAQSLKQQLWDFSSSCNEIVIDGYFDVVGKKPKTLNDYCDNCIDDSKNGYLFIQGSWPTCGCSCLNEIGAYRKANGKYTLLKYESWSCANSFGVYSTENLTNVFPENLSLKTFIPNIHLNDSLNYFYLKIKIPRIGTDTKVNLSLFPLGFVGIGTKGISYNTENSKTLYASLSSIQLDITKHIQNDNQLHSIIDKKINNLPNHIKNKIFELIGENKEIKSEEELIAKLAYLKKVYDLYISLEFTEMTLSWNRTLGGFEIKDKTGKPKKMTFLEFIKTSKYIEFFC